MSRYDGLTKEQLVESYFMQKNNKKAEEVAQQFGMTKFSIYSANKMLKKALNDKLLKESKYTEAAEEIRKQLPIIDEGEETNRPISVETIEMDKNSRKESEDKLDKAFQLFQKSITEFIDSEVKRRLSLSKQVVVVETKNPIQWILSKITGQ